MVILIDQLSPANAENLAPVVHEYTRPSGQIARVLWCKSADSSHSPYLQVEALLLDKEKFTTIQIPHWAVLSIVGSKDSPPVGFVWEEKTRDKSKDLAE